jgi:hypothetical protein
MPTGPCLLECGWCGLSNRRDRTATCIGCGGPLPAIPGAQAGPRPPEAPRALPAGYRGRVLWRKNVSVVIGLGFLFGFGFSLVLPFAGVEPVLYLPFLPFVAAGAVLFATGRRRALRRLKALEHGMVAEGRIVSLEHDRTQSINGVSPWQIRFEYRTQAGPLCGVVEGWDPAHAGRTVGEPVFVVHLAGKPHIHALWPPVY